MFAWRRTWSDYWQQSKLKPWTRCRSKKPSRINLQAELLETRMAMAAVPATTLIAPPEVLIGENFSFTTRFDNTGTDTGFGPYIDLFLPATGKDGGAAPGPADDDGITFVGATYLGVNVQAMVITLTAGGVAHPFARDANNNPVIIAPPPGCQEGDQLVVLQLPFGSFTGNQPPADVAVTVALSNFADVGGNSALSISSRGGFRFGNDALDNPSTDPTIIGSTVSTSVNPTLFRLTKTYIGPENETASGPNYTRQYRIDVDVAANQTVGNLTLNDILPGNLQYVPTVSASGGSFTDLSTANATTPGGNVTVRFDSVTGAAGGGDASMTFSFYAPRVDGGNASVLDPITGDDATAIDDAMANATWDPLDPRDANTTVISNATANDHTLTIKSIATQKSVTIANDTGNTGATPGDTLEYTISFQVSDYFAFGNIIVTDLFSAGQALDLTFGPILQVADGHSGLGNITINPASYTLTENVSGGSDQIVFRVSDQLAAANFTPGGVLAGGAIPANGTGSGNLPVSGNAVPFGATMGTITFRTVIQDTYGANVPGNNPPVLHGDRLTNDNTIGGNLVSVENLTTVSNQTETDNSSAGVTIQSGTFDKSIYAINGNTTLPPQPGIAPGDLVTYRLTYTLPATSTGGIVISDFLPLPIFLATQVAGPFVTTVSGNAPLAGQAKFGPTDTFFALANITPTIATSAADNRIDFTIGAFNDPLNTATAIDILFTVTVTTQPFADQLLLTNLGQVTEQATGNTIVSSEDIVQVTLQEPVLNISKGVVATENAAGIFTPTPVGPVTFFPPGNLANGAHFSGTINSVNLASTPIDSNLRNVDQSDLVTFAILVENTGSSPRGAFDVRISDTFPEGFVPAGVGVSGINLRVTDGAGNPLAFIASGNLTALGTVELVDPSGSQGALRAGVINGAPVTDGSNIVVITYDLRTTNSRVNEIITNVASLTNYANTEGGPDFTPIDLVDDATVQIAAPTMTKELISTSIVDATNSATEAVIGEIVTYRVRITVPEGTTPNAILVDTLDPELAYVSQTSGNLPSLVTLQGGNVTPTISNGGHTITWNLGNIVNQNSSNGTPEVIEFVYTAVVLNTADANAGDQVNNSVGFTYQGQGSVLNAAAPNVLIIEPQLQIAKSATSSPGVLDANDLVTYTIVLTNLPGANQRTANAYDVTFSDPLPTGLGGSLIVNPSFLVTDTAGQVTAANFVLDGNQTIGYTLRTANGADFDMAVDANRTITLQISGNLANTVTTGQVIPNNAETRWTSLPGDVGNLTLFNGNGSERTGAGGINDYVISDRVDLTVANPSAFKRIVATSANATTDPDRVVVGEIVRYRVAVAVPEATANSFQIRDAIPAGMQFLNDGTARIALVSDTIGNGAFFTASTVTDPAAYVAGSELNVANITPMFTIPGAIILGGPFGDGTDLTINLGTVQNLEVDPNFEFFVLEYNALVLNVASNQEDVGLQNRADVVVDGNASSNAVVTLVQVAEPSITDLTKNVFQAIGPVGLPLTPDNTSQDAGDTVRFGVSYSNAVGVNVSTAYDVILEDPLPMAKMTLVAGSVRVFRNGALAAPAEFTNATSGNTVSVTVHTVAPGDTIAVVYDAVLTTSVRAGEVVTNTANLTYTSLPGDNGPDGQNNPTMSATPGAPGNQTGERTGAGGINDYSDTALASIAITAPDLSKNILTTNLDQTTTDQYNPNLTDLAIGETVTYRLTITVPEGTSTLILTDVLPTSNNGTIEFISAQVVSIGGNISGSALAPGATGNVTGNTVTFNFGNMVVNTPNGIVNANDQIVVDVRGRVTNAPENVGNTTLDNVATLNYGTGSVVDNALAEVVAPILQIDKSVIGNTTYDAGNGANGTPNTITYQLVINHTANSSALAFDLTIADGIPAGLTYVANSAVVLAGNATITNNTSNLTVTSPELGLTGNITIQFQAYVNSTVAPGNSVTNTSTLNYDTFPGANPQQRPGAANDTAVVTLFTNSINGQVYEDDNNNGVRDGNEALILGNITLQLTGTDHLGCAVSSNITTSNGTYTFAGLRPGLYVVNQANQPTGYLDGRDGPGAGNLFGGTFSTGNDSDTIGNITIGLGGNKAGANYNFGELRPAAIGDFVWEDLDGNGRQDGAEPGIGNISVTLTGTDDQGAVSRNQTTAANGAYTFGDLRPGNYTVSFGNSSGTANYIYTTQNSPIANGATNSDGNQATGNTGLITLAVGENNANIDQGLCQPVAIGDLVWYDIDGSGAQNGTEPGIGNVTVRLYYDANFDGNITGSEATAPFATQATLTNGAYLFASLQPGTYRVDVNTGNLPNGLTANTTATSQDTGLLFSNQTDLNRDFGFRGTGNIGDRVYLDTNGDGNQATNGTEPNLPGVTVTLTWSGFDGILGNGDDIVYTTVTTNPGNNTAPNYLFGNLPTGNFSVSVPVPGSGGVPTNAVLTDAVDNGSLNASFPANTTLTAGNLSDLTLDFGIRGNASIGDNVWYDVDGSGTRNNAEPGIANAAVTLEWGGPDGNLATAADNVVYNTTTNANGNYLFSNLPVFGAGSPYRVSVTPPACFVTQTFDADGVATANQSTLVLGPNENNDSQDFGYRGNLAQGLGNFVWNDLNGNGRQDALEPGIGNVTVTLRDSTGASILATTTTNSNGAYSFTGLIAGNYAVQFGDVPGFVRTVPNSAVANEATDSDANVATGNTGLVTVAVGATNNDVDAGYYQPINIGDTVWIDFNSNGSQQPGEPGIANANVTVTWRGPDGVAGGGDDVSFSATTDGNGIYGIANSARQLWRCRHRPAGRPYHPDTRPQRRRRQQHLHTDLRRQPQRHRLRLPRRRQHRRPRLPRRRQRWLARGLRRHRQRHR